MAARREVAAFRRMTQQAMAERRLLGRDDSWIERDLRREVGQIDRGFEIRDGYHAARRADKVRVPA